jgi:hypothetical protein
MVYEYSLKQKVWSIHRLFNMKMTISLADKEELEDRQLRGM